MHMACKIEGQKMSETKVKIFISYSHADRALCETIADALGKAEGLSVWYDKELLAGEVYRNRIVEKIETADVFIVLLSQNSIKSKWVKKELEYAEEKLDRLVPVWLEDIELPGDWQMILQGHHGLFWHSRKSDSHFINSLAEALLQKIEINGDTSRKESGRNSSNAIGKSVSPEKLLLDDAFTHSEELQAALENFKQRRFETAFQAFTKLAEKNDVKAQIMLARMYEYGLGTKQSVNRADFWYGSAVKLGDVEAQCAYGKRLIAAENPKKVPDKTQWEKGMALLKTAADQKYLMAMKFYIEESCRGFSSFTHRICALGHCDYVIANSDDAYEKDKYMQAKKDLRNQLLKTVGKTIDTAISTIGAALGMVLCFAGTIYVIAGLLPALLDTNPVIGKLPAVTEEMLIPINVYWNWIFKFMTVFGAFGLQMILIGTIFHGTFKNRHTWKITETVGTLSFFGYIVVIIWYLCAYAKLGGEFSVGDQNQMAYGLLAVFISVVSGYVIGAIISKLLSAVIPVQEQSTEQTFQENK